MLKRLDNIGLAVRNARTSLQFYIDRLGFEGTVTDGEGSARLGDMSLYIFESKSAAPGDTRTDDYYANHTSRVAFRVTQGRTYYIAVDGSGPAKGTVVLSWSI